MNTNDHRERHRMLHQALDELVADWIAHTKALPSKTPVLQLIEWSFEQTQVPSPTWHEEHW